MKSVLLVIMSLAVFCISAASTSASSSNASEARVFQTVIRQALDAAPLNFSAIRGSNLTETTWTADVPADAKYLRRCKIYDFTENFMSSADFKPYWAFACRVVVEHGGTGARLHQIANEIAPAIPAGFTRKYRLGDPKYSRNEKVVWSGPNDTYVVACVYRKIDGSLNEIDVEVNHGPGADT